MAVPVSPKRVVWVWGWEEGEEGEGGEVDGGEGREKGNWWKASVVLDAGFLIRCASSTMMVEKGREERMAMSERAVSKDVITTAIRYPVHPLFNEVVPVL